MRKNENINIDMEDAAVAVKSETKLDIEQPFMRNIIIVMSLILVVFHIYTTIMGIFPALIQRSIHLGFALAICFALIPLRKKRPSRTQVPWYDKILIVLSLCTTLYIPFIYKDIISNPLVWVSVIDKIFALVLLLLIVEAGRRTVGWTFPILVMVVILYTYLGSYFPGKWGHQGFSLDVIMQNLYHSSNGIWGMMLGISATILAVFAIFGGTLIAIGAGESFFKLSQVLTGGSRGGPAKVSVVSSGLFGMISGSAVSNVVTTGNFTIPTMKKSGFSKSFAGAVEAVASTGGQLVPPVLGAAAFIIAQTLGIDYGTIALAALVPALLYYTGAFIGVDLEARKRGIPPSEKDSISRDISISSILIFVLPIGVFAYFLIAGYTPSLGGVWAILTGIVLFVILPLNKANESKQNTYIRKIRNIPDMMVSVSVASVKTLIQIAALLACAQIIVSLISMTGLGVKLSSYVISLANQSLFLGLVLTAVVCIVLGMGLPTTAAYVIGASVLGPALTGLGLEPLVAHLFIFYFAIMSTITPPVCAAIFLAAALANANWWKTAVDAMKLSLGAFVIPFAFVYSNSLLLMGDIPEITTSIVTAAGGVILLTIGSIGYFKKNASPLIRILFAVAGILLIVPSLMISLLGLILGAITMIIHLYFLKEKNCEIKEGSMRGA